MTDNSDDSDGDKVGYKKPPKSTRFKPGTSGNPKGRPKKNKTLEEEAKAIFDTRVSATINGRKTYITKRRLLIEQIINGAISGKNAQCMRLTMPLLKLADDAPTFEALPEDKAMLKKLRKNLSDDEDEK
jgi:hypothetical protein